MNAEILGKLVADPVVTAGWIVVGGLVVQIGLLIGGGVRRLFAEQKRSQLEQTRLALEIRAAQLRIQTVETEKSAWNGVRKFTVARKVHEAADTYSFYLEPHDRKPLPQFKPGQYLTFVLSIPGQPKPVVRCYSLSDIGRTTHYRVTIKRCPPPPDSDHPPGLSSSFFCEAVKVGDILDVRAPNGHFFLDLTLSRPVVLIAGGIGVTPLMTMATALTEAGDAREIWLFFGARNSTDHMFKAYLAEIAATNKNLHLHVCYSRPRPADAPGRDYQHAGRVSVDLLKQLLPSNNYDYFLCGPGPFMESITTDLAAWGVPDEWVHFEAFGPASVKKKPGAKAETAPGFAPAAFNVTFAKSGKQAKWDGTHDSLLALAEAQGVKIDAGCRAGGCGTCIVAIKSGEVDYAGARPEIEAGSCLTCIGKPKGPLVIDA
jgi:ferredoxin-NADP reductase